MDEDRSGGTTGVVLHDRPPTGLLEGLPPEWREALAGPASPESLTAEALGKLALADQLRLSALEDLGRAEELSGGSARTGAVLVGDDGRPTDARHLLREQTGSPLVAARATRVAHGLAHLPSVRAAARSGRVTLAAAEVIALDVVPLFETHLPARDVAAALADADEHLVRFASGSVDTGGLRGLVQDWMLERHPEAAERAAGAAHKARDVRYSSLGDGRHRTTIDSDAAAHELVRAFLASADTRPDDAGDRRTPGQRRHDALLELFGHGLGCAETASPSRTVLVVCPLEALTDPTTGAATGRWTGRLTREQLEAMCCDATSRLVLVRPDGQVGAVSSKTRDVPPSMRLAALARDEGRCRRRGCGSRACLELHHLVAVRDGGLTVITNLVHLCLRHHTLWHQDRIGYRHLDIDWTPSNDPPDAV